MALLVLGACGRIGFDVHADGGDTAPALDVVDAPPLACDASNYPCADPFFKVCGNLCYVVCNVALTRAAAAPACNAWGGALAIVPDATHHDCLATITNDSWVGLAQSSGAAGLTAGWQWIDGKAHLLNWNAGEPNDGDGVEDGAEQCGLFDSAGYIDAGCGELKRSVCSRPAP
jgi:hypothetical protein